MPILGILASGITDSKIIKSSYESIATVTPNGQSVSFTSIPQTYKHLQVRVMARRDAGVSFSNDLVELNNDSSNIYTRHYIEADGSSVNAGGGTGRFAGQINNAITGNNAASNTYGVYILDIYDYTNTSKYKTGRYISGFDLNGSGGLNIGSFLWQSTSAITSLDFDSYTYSSGSVFSLYGIKG
jgi:hypothetical protein